MEKVVSLALNRFQDKGALGDANDAITKGFDDWGVDKAVSEMLAFEIIGLTSFMGASNVIRWWQTNTNFTFNTLYGIATFLNYIVYSIGSLPEFVFWAFAIMENESGLLGEFWNITPYYNF